jgi:hypothetical protein
VRLFLGLADRTLRLLDRRPSETERRPGIDNQVTANVVQAGTINGNVNFYGTITRCRHCAECPRHSES